MRLLQAGAIPFRERNGRLEYLLVTSQGGNWIFPKGIVEPGDTPEETALKECREEAGVRGQVIHPAVGCYPHRKWLRECEVLVYLLHYEADTESWEERDIRRRLWCSFAEAKGLLKKAPLRRLLKEAHRRLNESMPNARE